MRTRCEHMEWCKERAIEYCDAGDPANALASFISDVGKHPDTADVASFAILIGQLHMLSASGMRNFIDGFTS